MTTGEVVLKLKAGLLKNREALVFSCANDLQAHEWVDQLSPLFDTDLMDDSAVNIKANSLSVAEEAIPGLKANLVFSPAPSDMSTCPRDLAQLTGYWTIFSTEPPSCHGE